MGKKGNDDVEDDDSGRDKERPRASEVTTMMIPNVKGWRLWIGQRRRRLRYQQRRV